MEELALWQHDFRDEAKLQQWLHGLKREKRRPSAVVIAARAALRAAPLQPPSVDCFDRAIFSTFWASAVGWAAARRPADADKLDVSEAVLAAEDIEVAGPVGSTHSAAGAGCAASAVSSPEDIAIKLVGRAIDRASLAGLAAMPGGDEAIWIATSADVRALANGQDPDDLAADPLWQEGAPDQATECWRRVRAALDAPHWLAWLDWYQRRIDGRTLSPERERLFATMPSHPDIRPIADQNLRLAEALTASASKV